MEVYAFQSLSLVFYKDSSCVYSSQVRKGCLFRPSVNYLSRNLPRWTHRRDSRYFSERKNTLSSSMTYTTEKLDHWLLEQNVDKKLTRCVSAVFDACKEIAYKIRTASCNKIACFNDFGDEQLAIDVLADKVIFENLDSSGVVGVASSEEVPREQKLKGNTNFAVGSIFGIWPGDKLVGTKGRDMAAAALVVYGPLDDFSARHGQWVHTNEFHSVEEGKLFAPGNLRAIQDNPGYSRLLQFWLNEKYQLRYTGGMVPDVNQILVKGRGVFCNPASASAKAKLRLLYELAPTAFVVEKAGEVSSVLWLCW
ncbi:Sedoheptulose-1,7-bisphosphatase, chloroplastic [Galdieria sulphuraria]|nr:Sedoheptulose-1,7-bisphosphatase, chloroplastic [Galdieria sulphuraria]